ncbi:hypothetical protein PHYC_02870 [Phycisphaerales bacterium]|nr:hypothetical protein PHYC_02870 [Phycisphaerales bacterium]
MNDLNCCECDSAADCRTNRPGHEVRALGLALAVTLGGVGIILGGWRVMVAAQVRLTPGHDFAERMALLPTNKPAAGTLEAETFERGRTHFGASCLACHGPEGLGVRGLGKDLVHSVFVATKSDGEMVKFLATGRAADDPLNTTKVPMPPRGGNAAFTDGDLRDIVVYVRGLQDPRRVPAGVAVQATPQALAAQVPTNFGEGLSADDKEWLEFGKTTFASSCTACHGAAATGIPGMGKDLVHSEFIKKLSDDELLAFIKRGRDPNDPLNTTKVAMPPKGGNPALDDEKLDSIVFFLRILQESATQ